jgi:uncharacterized protein
VSYSRFLVADLVRSPGAVDDIDVEVPLDMRFDYARIDDVATGSLRLEAASGGLIARGQVTVAVELVCQRCLGGFGTDLVVPIIQVFGNPDDEDSLPITGDGRIDLESAIRDEVGLSLPLTPICRNDCLGLCDTCGTDLNTSPCEGHTVESASPFASLQGLFHPD